MKDEAPAEIKSSAYLHTKTSFAAMAGVLLSRLSGVIRTIIVNVTFGYTTALDAFNVAFRFPNSLRDLFADGALSAAFMTSLVEVREKGTEAERKLIAVVVGFFSFVTLLIACLGLIYAHEFIFLISGVKFKESGGLPFATFLFRILVFYLPLTMLNAIAMAILGVLGQSFRAMNGSIFLSIGMIVGALIGSIFGQVHFLGVIGLAIGAMLGAFLQLLYQMLPLFRLGLITLPNFNPWVWWTYTPLHEILRRMTPRALGQGALTLALAVNTYFAIQLGTGVLTYIVTAVVIIQVPIGLFGVATGFATLPALTASLYKGHPQKFSELLVTSLRTTSWLATFTTLLFAFLIVPFYVLLFQHGRITFEDSIQNCIAICSYSIGIIFASGSKVLVNGLYALNTTRQIVFNALAYLAVNVTLTALLAPRLGILGLGISFGSACALDFWMNYIFITYLYKKKGYPGQPFTRNGQSMTSSLLMLTIASFVIGLGGVSFVKYFWQNIYSFLGFNLNIWNALLILFICGLLALGLFYAVLLKWGPNHLKEILEKGRLRLWP